MAGTRSAVTPAVPDVRAQRDNSPSTDLESEAAERGEPHLEDDEQDPLEALLQRERQLRKQLEQRAVQARIDELEYQLQQGDIEENHKQPSRAPSQQSESSSKRRAGPESDDEERSQSAYPQRRNHAGLRMKPPPEYRGKNIKEHKEFIRACELVFRESPVFYQRDAAKVLMALPYLKGEPADAYEREEQRLGKDCHTWEEFSKFLLDNVADPVNRMFTIAQQHHDALQGTGQKVTEFVTYLESLEAELDPYTEIQKQQILLTKLRPELRRRITDHQTVPTSRLELTRLATRLEENARHAKDRGAGSADSVEQLHNSRTSHHHNDRHDRKGRSDRYSRNNHNDRRQTKEDAQKPLVPPDGPATTVNRLPIPGSGPALNQGDAGEGSPKCYNCGKPGHFSRECRSRLRANAAAAKNLKASQ